VCESKKVENFFDVNVKASNELEKAIAAELEVEDPDTEKAKAILMGDEDDTEGT
jgi:hypothetical protein